MLPREHRMRRSTDFAVVVRSGDRARRGHVVVHQRTLPGRGQPIVGLVVGKAVGPSVVRHRVSRRLRAQLAARLDTLGEHCAIVVRALPGADQASSAELGADLDAAFTRLARSR
ncbi:MAG: ribonuclease P protein component [Pseudonocardiales bacterium]